MPEYSLCGSQYLVRRVHHPILGTIYHGLIPAREKCRRVLSVVTVLACHDTLVRAVLNRGTPFRAKTAHQVPSLLEGADLAAVGKSCLGYMVDSRYCWAGIRY